MRAREHFQELKLRLRILPEESEAVLSICVSRAKMVLWMGIVEADSVGVQLEGGVRKIETVGEIMNAPDERALGANCGEGPAQYVRNGRVCRSETHREREASQAASARDITP